MVSVIAQQALPTRVHPRVEAGFMVKLHIGGRAVLAKATDLSMTGLRLVGNFVDAEERLDVTVLLPAGHMVLTRATVRRRTGEELALEFDQLDWDDMITLARYVHPRLS